MDIRNTQERLCVVLTIALLAAVFLLPETGEVKAELRPSGAVIDQARPSIKRFTSSDGLPVNSVMTIERDERGFVWFGTQDGAAVYDGSSFSVLNMPNRSASNYVYDILAAQDGSIWFGTNGGGVHRYKEGEWETFNTGNGLGSNEIRALLETVGPDGESVIWVGRRDGLSRLQKGKWDNFGVDEGLPDSRIRSLLSVGNEVWIGTYGGIAVWDGKRKKVYGEDDGLPGSTVFGLGLSETSAGRTIWAGTDKGVASYSEGTWTTYEGVDERLARSARALGVSGKADGTKTVWAGFDGAGLAFLEGEEWRFLDKDNGLPNNLVYAFEETGAPDGSVWISNLTAGVSRFQRSDWRSIGVQEGLPNDIVFSVEELAGDYFFGTYGGGLAVFKGGRWITYDRDDGLPSNFIQALERVGERLIIGTEEGLAEYSAGKFRKLELPDSQGVFEIWDIESSGSEGSPLLLGTSGGVVSISDSGSRVFTNHDGLKDRRVRSISRHLGKDGKVTLWAGTYTGGLARFRDDDWTTFGEGEGLPSSRVYSAELIRRGETEQLWVGTGGGGIAVLDLKDEGAGFQVLTAEGSGLIPSDTVYQIFADRTGRIYATTNKGVARITPAESGSFDEFRSYVFTTEDGLPDNECVSGASFLDSEGRVWIGTVAGAAVLDVANEFLDDKADPIYIRRVTVGGEEQGPTSGMEITYDRNSLVFEYVMPTSFRESATEYRTQLVGLEDAPTEWSRDTRREFTFVPSGDFEFRVWARDSQRNISGPVTMPFIVHPAWWQTWWAFVLYFFATAAVVALVAFLVYRNRYNRLLEIERVRARIASDLHDDVGASLSKISIISEMLAYDGQGRAEEEKDSLLKIAQTSRDVVGSMGDMVWSINPSKDNLQETVQRMRRFASDVLSPRDIDLEFSAPEKGRLVKLNVDLRRQLYLVFKEAVNNAAKYSDCEKVSVDLNVRGSEIRLKVTDDGKGFDVSSSNGGNGLSNMKMRMEAVAGELRVRSSEGDGTVIEASAPLRQ
ncbi:MAG: hypothetical protein DWQ47_04340 [Acidobacteria bacterium]|nr:MAG: hypothetical protein DWQ32_07890 [Acidobacteriota bacterium]REK01621.1 MAG: hypothetical protein DWQ38_04325 [Acidobacteriota bacterium]REK14577.1 MAG: hypothetical protein DWQ43_13580 [Acidobacteriota bacterium]REK45292.1 MAG: hypothetical protein DWQ47_04340 [Acidobacteriota bacterium]